MSALISHRVSAVNSREGNISRWRDWGGGGFGVRLCACSVDENWQPLACMSFPKTVCVACWTKRMDSLKARLAWLVCLACWGLRRILRRLGLVVALLAV